MKLQLTRDFELSDGKHPKGFIFEMTDKNQINYFLKKGLATQVLTEDDFNSENKRSFEIENENRQVKKHRKNK